MVVNPASGKGRGASLRDPILAALGTEAEVAHAQTTAPGEEASLTRKALAAGYRTIVAVGGDGTWSHVGAVIVESGLRDIKVTPSQGSHFFQNLTSFNVGYFTVNPDANEGFVDWSWLTSQPALRETTSVRHIRTSSPFVIKMNGKLSRGAIWKPATSLEAT